MLLIASLKEPVVLSPGHTLAFPRPYLMPPQLDSSELFNLIKSSCIMRWLQKDLWFGPSKFKRVF